MELNKIYQGDCLEIMKTFPDKSVDLVVTDPPYGMSYLSNYYKEGNPHGKIIGDELFNIDIIKKEFFRLARKAVFVFCRWNNLLNSQLPTPNSFIVWAKNNWTAGDLYHAYARQWEGILFYAMENHTFKKRQSDIVDYRRIPPNKLLHPTEKPVGLIEYFIENNSEVGDIVLDPFLGSGTTAVACKKLNRNYIGIELNPDYIKIAEKRIRNIPELLL